MIRWKLGLLWFACLQILNSYLCFIFFSITTNYLGFGEILRWECFRLWFFFYHFIEYWSLFICWWRVVVLYQNRGWIILKWFSDFFKIFYLFVGLIWLSFREGGSSLHSIRVYSIALKHWRNLGLWLILIICLLNLISSYLFWLLRCDCDHPFTLIASFKVEIKH